VVWCLEDGFQLSPAALISMHEGELERSEVRGRISFVFYCSDKQCIEARSKSVRISYEGIIIVLHV
jgi:hypothetical protein